MGAGEVPIASRAPLRLGSINGLRGVAILSVLYSHLIYGMWPAAAVPIWLSPLLTNGWTGVNLFFMLSGFVLFLPYAAGERRMVAPSDRMAFYRRRFWRLMPLFYVAVIGEWLLAAWQGHGDVGALVWTASLGFMANPREFGPPFNFALWSIGIEIGFSVLFPSLVVVVRRFGLIRLLAGALVLSLAIRVLGILRLPALQGPTFNSDMLLCRLDDFVIGMALAQLYVGQRLPRRTGASLFAGVAVVLLAWVGFDRVLRGALPPLARAGLNDVLDAGLFLIALAALVPGTRLAGVLCWRPLQVLGMMCYSIYIWHLPIFNLLMPDRATLQAGPFAVLLAIAILLLAAVATASYRFIEFGRIGEWRKLFLLDLPRKAEAPI